MKQPVTQWARWWRIDLAGLGACALVSALGYFGLVRPALNHQQTYKQLVPKVAERSDELARARADLKTMQDQLEQTGARLDALPLRLEQASRVNSRVARLADLASEMGLEVHEMLPDKARSGKRYDVVPISLSGAGDYNHVTRFMQRVHDSFADIAVMRFDLASDNPGSDDATFDIDLAWYTLPAMGMAENP